KRRLGDLGGARADLERVERALAADGDAPPVRLARVRTALASMRFDRSEFAGAEKLLSKAEEALRALGKDGELPLVDTAETRAHLDLTLGRYDDARRRIDEIESILLRREGPRAPRLLTVSLLRSRLDSAESRFDA